MNVSATPTTCEFSCSTAPPPPDDGTGFWLLVFALIVFGVPAVVFWLGL